MKRMFAGLITALMMASGLVVAGGAVTTSSNAAQNCGYGGCIPTNCSIKALSPKKNRVRVVGRVSSDAGTPRGRLKLVISGNGYYRQAKKTAPSARTTFKRVPRGTYIARAQYVPNSNTRFASCKEYTIISVKGKPRRRNR